MINRHRYKVKRNLKTTEKKIYVQDDLYFC